jgi:long-subunit fatty acid transport protein
VKTGQAAIIYKEAELLTFGVNPGVGYRVNDRLSVGAGFSILYAELL